MPSTDISSDWKLSDCGSYWIYTLPLEKSDNDDREYRLIKLASNDLEVLLVHDEDTDKSSAALDVHVGHLSDPVSCAKIKGKKEKQQRKKKIGCLCFFIYICNKYLHSYKRVKNKIVYENRKYIMAYIYVHLFIFIYYIFIYIPYYVLG